MKNINYNLEVLAPNWEKNFLSTNILNKITAKYKFWGRKQQQLRKKWQKHLTKLVPAVFELKSQILVWNTHISRSNNSQWAKYGHFLPHFTQKYVTLSK